VATDAVQQAKELLQARLSELDKERTQLEHALRSLGSTGQARRGPRAASSAGTRRRRSGGKRARRGQREGEFLSQVESNPGAKISEIAKTMGVAPQQLYPIARRLSDSGKVSRSGDGFQVASSQDTSSQDASTQDA
jgi:hypothetical protein